jgi:hypothetical protein
MSNIEKEIIKAVNDLRCGYNSKYKCSIFKVVKKRNPQLNSETLKIEINKMI